jgi:exosome complex RNA-binding protein Rrp4
MSDPKTNLVIFFGVFNLLALLGMVLAFIILRSSEREKLAEAATEKLACDKAIGTNRVIWIESPDKSSIIKISVDICDRECKNAQPLTKISTGLK